MYRIYYVNYMPVNMYILRKLQACRIRVWRLEHLWWISWSFTQSNLQYNYCLQCLYENMHMLGYKCMVCICIFTYVNTYVNMYENMHICMLFKYRLSTTCLSRREFKALTTQFSTFIFRVSSSACKTKDTFVNLHKTTIAYKFWMF